MAKKETLSASQLLVDISKGKFAPVYFLQGEEPYYIDKIADALLDAVVPEAERDFNLTLLYGGDTTMRQVISAARRYPMMSERQLVVVREAQMISDDFDLLENYLRQPMVSTVLVICYKYKTYDARKKLMKLVAEHGVVFESKRIYDDRVPEFVAGYVREQGVDIEPKAAQMMAEFVGADLTRLASELNKLCLSPDLADRRITASLVERNIGISKEYNSFELIKAIANRDIYRSMLIAGQLGKSKSQPIMVVTATLFNFFATLMLAHYEPDKSEQGLMRNLGIKNFYAARDYITALRNYNAFKTMYIISLIRETDARSKGFGGNFPPDELLRECVFKILHM